MKTFLVIVRLRNNEYKLIKITCTDMAGAYLKAGEIPEVKEVVQITASC